MLSLVLAALAAPTATTQSGTLENPSGPGRDGPVVARIINGDEASRDDFPQAGGMLMDAFLDMGSYGSGNVRMFVCSSTLIAPDVVMLAAHCLDEMAFTYGYGSMDINEVRWSRQADLTDWDGTTRARDWPDDSIVAIDWVTHREFDLRSLGMGVSENADIALLFLSEPVLDTPFAYVPTPAEGDQIEEGTVVTVVGWGQQVATSGWESPPAGSYAIKQWGEAPVGLIGDYEFQVGPDEDNVRKCHGDSGGPTFTYVETDAADALRVIGVTSHAFDSSDCNETGGVDTRVMAYRDWVENQMIARCEDGSRVWCETPGLPVPPLPPPPQEEAEEEEDPGLACGCASADGGFGLFGVALGVLAVARRRR